MRRRFLVFFLVLGVMLAFFSCNSEVLLTEEDGSSSGSGSSSTDSNTGDTTDQVIPYEFNADVTAVTFIFRPDDFSVEWESDTSYTIQLISEFTDWDIETEEGTLAKGTDGNYTLTVSTTDVYSDWRGFEFYVEEMNLFLSAVDYKHSLSLDKYKIKNNGGEKFLLTFPECEPTITFDLNGGAIEGEATKDGDDYVDYVPFGVGVTVYAKFVEAEELTLRLHANSSNSYLVAKSLEYASEPLTDEDGTNLSTLEIKFETGATFSEVVREYAETLGDYYTISAANYEDEADVDSDGNARPYVFAYFADAAVGGEKIPDDKILVESTAAYAAFDKQYKVTFDPNGGTMVGDVTSWYMPAGSWWGGSTPQTKKAGYVFKGWTATKDGDDIVGAQPDKDMTVYASYRDFAGLFDEGDIIGDFAPSGAAMTKESENSAAVVYTHTFTYSSDMNAWGSERGQCQFKLRTVAGDWGKLNYGCYYSSLTLDGDEIDASVPEGWNISVGGLEEGTTYKITVRCASDGGIYVGIATVTGDVAEGTATE